jgi:alkylhydroperoxidase family enzyme
MPRIRPLNPEETSAGARAELERLEAERGNMPNMWRTLAWRPEMMETAAAHLRAVFETGTVDTRLKEMLAVRVSQINNCMY